VVTVNAPTERRRASRARAPAMCHLPRDATAAKISSDTSDDRWSVPVCTTRLLPG
jgi:hypothetical protein